ncbi:MAG: UbiX family flavin prenyltransferase [Candidatus Heimdallarchaeota archaeon]|nr:UbiX family flavin prenyltransferase [Candidatus Heimdallarchaeota archaeon]
MCDLESKRIIVGLTGASGIIYGIEVIKALKANGIEVHVITSEWANYVLADETELKLSDLESLVNYLYDNKNMSASISSSSFLVDGMIVIPATVKSVSNIANGYTGDLISRAADNMLKMRKSLIVAFRETPVSPACLHNLAKLATYGATILPLAPGFYHNPQSLQDLYNFITGKVLDCLNIPNTSFKRWNERKKSE